MLKNRLSLKSVGGPKFFVASESTDYLLELSTSKGLLTVFNYVYSYPSFQLLAGSSVCCNFDAVTDRVFRCTLTWTISVFVLSKDSSPGACIFSFEEAVLINCRCQLTLQFVISMFCGLTDGAKGKTILTAYWDEKASMLKFTHTENLRYKFKCVPFIKMSCYMWFILCFVDGNQDILVVDIQDDVMVLIPNRVHKIDKIDCISTWGSHCLFLWSVISQSTSVLMMNGSDWELTGKFHWDREKPVTRLTLSNGESFVLIPYLNEITKSESASTNEEQNYIFCISKLSS